MRPGLSVTVDMRRGVTVTVGMRRGLTVTVGMRRGLTVNVGMREIVDPGDHFIGGGGVEGRRVGAAAGTDALGEGAEVGGEVEARGEAGMLKDAVEHGGHGAFALGAGHVDLAALGFGAFGMTKVGAEGFHGGEPEVVLSGKLAVGDEGGEPGLKVRQTH
jgi:hypothetical protein